MNLFDNSVRSTYELKQGLLKQAFADENGGDMILRILWVCASARNRSSIESGLAQLARFEKINQDKPMALRALNLLEEKSGRNLIHRDATEREQRQAYLAAKLPGIILTT